MNPAKSSFLDLLRIWWPVLPICSLWMLAAWALARRLRNVSIVDAAWAFAFTPCALLLPFLAGASTAHAYLLPALLAAWSLRLGTHIALRIARQHPHEDPRYRELRQLLPDRPWLLFFVFFQLQALLAAILLLPLALSLAAGPPPPTPLQLAAAALALLAIAGEWLADAQLASFKRSSPPGAICDRGLWAWSRHPNYFFEWLFWIAISFFVLPLPSGWLALSAPAIMLWFLLRMTGIPATEAHMLATRGDAFRDYCRRTSPFLPLPPGRKPRPPCDIAFP